MQGIYYTHSGQTDQFKAGSGRPLPAVSICVILVLFFPSTMKTGLKADTVIQSGQDFATRTQQGKKYVVKWVLLNKAALIVRVCIVKGL